LVIAKSDLQKGQKLLQKATDFSFQDNFHRPKSFFDPLWPPVTGTSAMKL